MLFGIRLCSSHFCNTSWNLANIGNAVNTASTTVIKGTKAMVVVKVRLLAVKPKWSSRKRSRRVDAVLCHGKCARLLEKAARRCNGVKAGARGAIFGGTGDRLMAAMMPL